MILLKKKFHCCFLQRFCWTLFESNQDWKEHNFSSHFLFPPMKYFVEYFDKNKQINKQNNNNNKAKNTFNILLFFFSKERYAFSCVDYEILATKWKSCFSLSFKCCITFCPTQQQPWATCLPGIHSALQESQHVLTQLFDFEEWAYWDEIQFHWKFFREL